MIIVYIITSVMLLLFLIVVIPHTIHFKLDYEYGDNSDLKENNNYFKVNIFGILPVLKKKFLKKVLKTYEKKDIIDVFYDIKKSISKNREIRKSKGLQFNKFLLNIPKCIKYNKLILSLGINMEEYIANSYVTTSLITIISMYINCNSIKFNFNKLYYEIYTSNKMFNINIDASISINLLSVIFITFKHNINKK